MAYSALPYLDDPANLPVWRYISIDKLLSVLLDKVLFFANAAILSEFDKYEGKPTASEIIGLEPDVLDHLENRFAKPVREQFFFNCWHMNDSESDAMWKIYSSKAAGVAIRSTIARLKQSFCATTEDIHLGRIRYINDETGHMDHLLRRYMRKKRAFAHEQEVRLVFYDDAKTYSAHAGVSIPVDVGILIEQIVISPRAPNWIFLLIKNLLSKLEYTIAVVPSGY